MNRSFWIAGEHGPLVERLGARPLQRPVVVSYLPWAQQLGRNEVADELLLEVLRIAAGSLPEPSPLRRMTVLSADTELGKQERAILAAASRATPKGGEVDILTVLDLRGETTLPHRHRRTLAGLEMQVSPTDPLLILGDDKLLDRWSWLRMDRKKQKIKEPPGLTWLQNDTIPPSVPVRLRQQPMSPRPPRPTQPPTMQKTRCLNDRYYLRRIRQFSNQSRRQTLPCGPFGWRSST